MTHAGKKANKIDQAPRARLAQDPRELVSSLIYSQLSYAPHSTDGWPLNVLLEDLMAGSIDPMMHPDMLLEVVRTWEPGSQLLSR